MLAAWGFLLNYIANKLPRPTFSIQASKLYSFC
jgi:hypothetical protein